MIDDASISFTVKNIYLLSVNIPGHLSVVSVSLLSFQLQYPCLKFWILEERRKWAISEEIGVVPLNEKPNYTTCEDLGENKQTLLHTSPFYTEY